MCKDEFAKYLTYARHLKFEEQPDYDYLIKLFNTVMKKQHLVDDGIFDWMQLDGSKVSRVCYSPPSPTHALVFSK